jgi:hypothetical protein
VIVGGKLADSMGLKVAELDRIAHQVPMTINFVVKGICIIYKKLHNIQEIGFKTGNPWVGISHHVPVLYCKSHGVRWVPMVSFKYYKI